MNWSRAKNLSLMAFVLLNLVLALLNYLDSRRYILAPEHIANITTVLEQHQVSLDKNFTFIDHRPMRQLSFEPYPLNQNWLVGILMRNNTNISVLEEDERTVFSTETERVSFYGGRVVYENISHPEPHIQSLQEARIFAASLVVALGDMGRYFVLDRSISTGETLELSYREIFRNETLESNFINFTFEGGRLIEISFNYDRVTGFIGNARETRRADEVMLTFARVSEAGTQVLEMDRVYLNINSVGTPHYRIFYTHEGTQGMRLINAYTNTLTTISRASE